MRIIVPPVLAFICITAMVILRWLLPVKMLINPPWNLIGIVPIIIGQAEAAVEAAQLLAGKGFFVPAIRYPTVARDAARLRSIYFAGLFLFRVFPADD